MKIYKRLFALLLTLCMLLSAMLPATFAEDTPAADDSGVLTYSFFDNTVTSGTTKYQNANANKGEVSFTSDPAASYLNTSYSTGGVQLASSYFLAGFSKDRTVQDWCALKISDVVAGTYDMTFDLQNSTKAGVFTVFVVTENAYSTILNNGEKDYVSTLSAGGDLTQAQNKEILTALESAALNQVSEGKLDNGNLNDVPELQSIGKVTFPENGNYVIVFRCDGVSDNCEKTGARLLLNSLTMTPDIKLVYSFFDNKVTSGTTKYQGANANKGEVSFTSDPAASYLNTSYSTGGVQLANSYFLAGFSKDRAVQDWCALKISNVVAGTYDMTFDLQNSTKAGVFTVFVVTENAYSTILNNEEKDYVSTLSAGGDLTQAQNKEILTALEGAALNQVSEGKLDNGNLNDMPELQSIGKVTFPENGNYVIVFRCDGASDNCEKTGARLLLNNLTVSSTGPVDSDSGEDSGDSGNDKPASFPVKEEIAAQDAILTSEIDFIESAVNPANGHDYLYVMFTGGKMNVYDLDTREKVDSVTDIQNSPHSSYVDDNGILWICGGNLFLYRYDPVTRTGTRISAPNDLFGDFTNYTTQSITGGEDGKLYFGTYNRAHFGAYDPKTGKFEKISDWLDEDAMYSAFGGMSVKDGYIYAAIDGNLNADESVTHRIIKYSIAEKRIVDSVDLSGIIDTYTYVKHLSMADSVLFASIDKNRDLMAVDTTGAEMDLIEISGLPYGMYGRVSEKLNGKYYFFGYTESEGAAKCLYEYDSVTKTATAIPEIPFDVAITGDLVTIENDSRLPGQSLLAYRCDTGSDISDIIVYNPETKQTVTVMADFLNGEGKGNALTGLTIDEAGENIYLNAYGTNKVAQYNVAAGAVVWQTPTYRHQTDSTVLYDGYLYTGNYTSGTICQVDLNDGTVKPLFQLYDNSPFCQKRMPSITAGDGKVFCGTVPDSGRYGGVLVWYDLEEKLTYVAAGPNPEDVYYAETFDWENSQMLSRFTWHNAVTGEAMDFDDDDDGIDDYNITVNGVSQQRFAGMIPNQCIIKMIYKDGYIYGITTKHGGSGANDMTKYADNAVIFVYDVAAMKVIGTCDLSQHIEGLTSPVIMVDAIGADPSVEGKFWGVVTDTLFSFTFDAETATFCVNVELSEGLNNYVYTGSYWVGRDMVFDGEYMYVIFGSKGVYMVNRSNPQENYFISGAVPKNMALAADDNLYFRRNANHLFVLRIAELTAPIKDPSEAAAAQTLIDALDDAANITMEDDAAVLAAREAYDALSDTGKAMVNAEKLLAAEAVLAPLRAAADRAAADAVIAKIAAIGTVTLDSEEAIKTACAAYDALTDAQKALVSNLDVLTAAEAKLAELKTAAEQEAADKAAVANAEALIAAIGKVTKESGDAIKAARNAYDALTAAQKEMVTSLKVLTDAEAAYEDAIKEPSNPGTGDHAPVMLLVCIALISVMAIAAVPVIRKKVN